MKCEDERSILIIIAAASLVIYIIFFSGPKSARGLGAENLEADLLASEEADISAGAAAASAASVMSAGFFI